MFEEKGSPCRKAESGQRCGYGLLPQPAMLIPGQPGTAMMPRPSPPRHMRRVAFHSTSVDSVLIKRAA